jgi:hypothetical protein
LELPHERKQNQPKLQGICVTSTLELKENFLSATLGLGLNSQVRLFLTFKADFVEIFIPKYRALFLLIDAKEIRKSL